MATKHVLKLYNGTILAIDATQELTETFKSKATNLPTASRESVADHFIKENPTFSFSGVISGVYNPRSPNLNDPTALSQNFRNVVQNGNIVEFTSGDRSFKNCHVDSVVLKRDVEVGKTGWRISVNLTQIQIAKGGKESVVSINPNVTDQATNKKDVGSSSTKDVCPYKEVQGLGRAIGKKAYGSVCGT
jgi:hypothetical protein